MTDVRPRLRLARFAISCALAAWLGACFAANKPLDSTYTGNPPVVDGDRISLKLREAEVHVQGKAGAVEPGGARIDIKNLSSGATTRAKAAEDGSFDVKVEGQRSDVFEVRAQGAGGSSSKPVFVIADAAVSGPSQTLSCDQRGTIAAGVLHDTTGDLDQSCSSDTDCEVSIEALDCSPGCTPVVTSKAGAREFRDRYETIQSRWCGSCSSNVIVDCEETQAECREGRCVRTNDNTGQTCEQRSDRASAKLLAVAESADNHCNKASECFEPELDSSCSDDCGGHTPVSADGLSSIQAAKGDVERGACAGFDADGCKRLTVPCIPPVTSIFACEVGRCVRKILDCPACLAESIGWGLVGGNIAFHDYATLAPCAHYSRERRPTGDGGDTPLFTCETEFTSCDAPASAGAVIAALGHPDVQQAFTQDSVLYGAAHPDAASFEIRVGMKVIHIAGSCEGAPPNCIPAPSGVQDLAELLQAIDTQLANTSQCSGFQSR